MSINVIEPGFFTTIQDLGRYGYQRFGVPVSGAMDRFALMAANMLVKNPPGAACLEIGMQGAVFSLDCDSLLALTGSGFEIYLDGQKMPGWTAVFARHGQTIRILKKSEGCWATLAVAGGIESEIELGSRATYLRSRFGKDLQSGNWLPSPEVSTKVLGSAGCILPLEKRPAYCQDPVLEVIPGPQEGRFSVEGLENFYRSEFVISANSDRMGYRLEGVTISHNGSADILSEGMVYGSVQVPADGQPIVMMCDCPATGGYTKIATVCSADLPLLAQCTPGSGRIRFRNTTVEMAQKRYRVLMEGLLNGIIEPGED